jgi:hypothetical protein
MNAPPLIHELADLGDLNMERLMVEIPLSRARLCMDCDNIFDNAASSTSCCPVCTGQGTASVEAWLNRVPPLGMVKSAPGVLQLVPPISSVKAVHAA